jgi:hypothetical protein
MTFSSTSMLYWITLWTSLCLLDITHKTDVWVRAGLNVHHTFNVVCLSADNDKNAIEHLLFYKVFFQTLKKFEKKKKKKEKKNEWLCGFK